MQLQNQFVALGEKMKNESDSIFTKIINGEIPCHKIYEDELVFAFLDINPCSTGHTLVVPKEQAETLDKLSEKSSMGIGRVLPIISKSILEVTGAKEFNILQNNGPNALQTVFHELLLEPVQTKRLQLLRGPVILQHNLRGEDRRRITRVRRTGSLLFLRLGILPGRLRPLGFGWVHLLGRWVHLRSVIGVRHRRFVIVAVAVADAAHAVHAVQRALFTRLFSLPLRLRRRLRRPPLCFNPDTHRDSLLGALPLR